MIVFPPCIQPSYHCYLWSIISCNIFNLKTIGKSNENTRILTIRPKCLGRLWRLFAWPPSCDCACPWFCGWFDPWLSWYRICTRVCSPVFLPTVDVFGMFHRADVFFRSWMVYLQIRLHPKGIHLLAENHTRLYLDLRWSQDCLLLLLKIEKKTRVTISN